PEEHRYFIAEQAGTLVAFLSAVPVYARGGWLVEDVPRATQAPNGTTETLICALMEEVADSAQLTLGLTPLAGPVAPPLRLIRWLSRPLFDFAGLQAFRQRLRASASEPVWLVFPRTQTAHVSIIDSLRAFADGSLLRFALASLLRHPSGLPWALALPLPLWTAALAWLAATHRASLLGFPRRELLLWVAFDALLLVPLVRAAMRPRRRRLLFATGLAGLDALLSISHVLFVGLGGSAVQEALRGLGTGAPVVGAALLAWSSSRAHDRGW
ncbi:MAG: phosphatidylglycerol lysyltransferase domain-containing protein, partial [Polyangiaceae bacterium]